MNNTITSREDLLLAKIAGKEVNINTMTPPVAMNNRERLLLDIADRLDDFDSGSSTDNSPFEVTGVVGQNESEKTTFTFNKTAAELYALCQTGKKCKLIFTVSDTSFEYIGDILTVRTGSGDSATYTFMLHSYNGEIAQYIANDLTGTDTVVLTEI